MSGFAISQEYLCLCRQRNLDARLLNTALRTTAVARYLLLDLLATRYEVLQCWDGRHRGPAVRIEKIARRLARPAGEHAGRLKHNHFMEATILFENNQMRNVLDAIDVISGRARNLNTPSATICTVTQSQVELTSIRSELTSIRAGLLVLRES